MKIIDSWTEALAYLENRWFHLHFSDETKGNLKVGFSMPTICLDRCFMKNKNFAFLRVQTFIEWLFRLWFSFLVWNHVFTLIWKTLESSYKICFHFRDFISLQCYFQADVKISKWLFSINIIFTSAFLLSSEQYWF